ncbi:MAG: hypothetical protein QM757_06175 [Paludibaculum sp.]
MDAPDYKELISRLPRTFGPALNDQLHQWAMLFQAEQRQLKAQMDWLAKLPPAEFKSLFAPIVQLEDRMELPKWQPGSTGLSIHDVGVMARSPLYPQWRQQVEKVFAHIDDSIQAAGVVHPVPRLVVCILPSGLPKPTEPMWPELAELGRWVRLDRPFLKVEEALVPAIVKRKPTAGLEADESTWVIECGKRLSAESGASTSLSWDALEKVRREFLNRLNSISRDIKSADQTTNDLKRLDIRKFLDPATGESPRLREFLRGILLSGNGSLVFNNSFVQWAASEALRRAQPQVMLAGFGLRQKLKPFSSVVLFEDQHRSNPIPDQDDPVGSLTDAAFLAQYVYLAAQRVPAYQGHTVSIFAMEDLDRVLVVDPRGKQNVPESLTAEALAARMIAWLTGSA